MLPGKRGPQVVLVVPDSRPQREGPEVQVTEVAVVVPNMDPVARAPRSLTRHTSMEWQSLVLLAVLVEQSLVHREAVALQDR